MTSYWYGSITPSVRGVYLATKSMVGAGYSESLDKVYLPPCNYKGKGLCGLLRLGK